MGDGEGARSRVEQDAPAVGNLLESPQRHPLLLRRTVSDALIERGLRSQRIRGDGTAVHAREQSAAFEDGEVATDRLGRDVQLIGERTDFDPAL